MTKLTASKYFYDDKHDTIGLHEVSVDDDEVAQISLENGVLTVTGLKAGNTEIRMKAVDTGMLVSKQHTVTLTVDAGPEASDKDLDDATSSLSLEATGDPVYKTPLPIQGYFKLNAINASETHSYSASSSDESVAQVTNTDADANVDGIQITGTDQVDVTLKALGETTITLKVMEAAITAANPATTDNPAPSQSWERTFVLTVVE
jgi:hypothetical protein